MKQAEEFSKELITLFNQFKSNVDLDLRKRVLSLIPVWDELRKLGITLIPAETAKSARDRILHYFKQYPKTIISHRELMIISGISEWARRVRELRKEFGWSIVSGITAKEMQEAGDIAVKDSFPDCTEMRPDSYILFDNTQDRDAAFRWKLANDIRKSRQGAKSSILEFFKQNIGKVITGEELRYVANDKSEWARRIRELRTEDGWSISTFWNGRPELPSGTYLLEDDRQQPVHDRKIPDPVRRKVLVRDNYTCNNCKWQPKQWNKSDPRHLELHHIKPHVDGGKNIEENLITLCNICHDEKH